MQQVKLTNSSLYAVVDDEDYAQVVGLPWRAHVCTRTAYAVRSWREDGKTRSIYLHRQLLNVPPGMEVDHIDFNGLNNTRKNIRIVTPSFNRRRGRPRVSSITPLKGVWWSSRNKNWHAETRIRGVAKWDLGVYQSQWHAALAYNFATKTLLGEEAYQNLIPIEEMPCSEEVRVIKNRIQSIIKGVPQKQGPPFKAHCKRGHALEGDNLYWHTKRGVRMCRACMRFRKKA